jgi:copper chaperone CopZ
MCKDRIETAAYSVRGVRSASWDQQKNLLTVNYRANRTSQEEIEHTIAKAGHDTESFITDEETYKNLHHCCKYPRDPEMLKNNKVHNQE